MPAASVSEAVGDATRAAVEALGLTGVTVVKRKTPSRPEGAQAGLPEVVISVGEEGKSVPLTATEKLKTYPVAVTIVTAGGKVAGDDATTRSWRQQVELKLEARATWGAVTGFNQVTITNKVPFDTQALGKDFNFSTVVAAVEVIEARGT